MTKVPLGGMLFALVNFHTLFYIITTHFTCVFSLLVNDIYIVGHFSNVVLTFFFNIRIFHSINEMCNLVST